MKIGLIAGAGQFPLLFAKKAAQNGYEVVAAGFKSETDPTLAKSVAVFQWLHLGQLARLIHYFKDHGVNEAVMLGSIKKASIFKDIRPDFKALSFIAKRLGTHDDAILSSFADLMAKEGIKILSSTFLLPELLSPEGCWTRRKPDRADKKDIRQGWHLASEIGKLDIGQCIVIANGTVLAVEAIEGTDAAIARGGDQAKENRAVVVKRSKPGQDLRFDLPCTGRKTIEVMAAHGASVLVLEADKSVSFDRDEMIALADSKGICILAVADGNLP